MTSNLSVLECLFNDIHGYRVKGQIHKCDDKPINTRTIKDFTTMKGAAKIELCATSMDEVIVTAVTGDTWGVFGMGKNELVGRNILRVGKMSREFIDKVFKELDETGFVFKEIEFNGRRINSILMLREGNNLVEIAWVKDAIK